MRRVLGVLLAVCALSSALASPAFAVTRVTGYVRDINTKLPIKGVLIKSGLYSAKTNAAGKYTVRAKAGRPTLYVTVKRYLKTYQVVTTISNTTTSTDWYLTPSYPTNAVPAHNVTILAWNDLGMHCDQDSYKYFDVLPPFNTLHAQVFSGGEQRSGYTVTYAFAKKTDSTLHTDFWQYASSFGYGALAPNVGLTGNGLSGTMVRDSNGLGYVATGIPVTPYDDDGTWDPYGVATITVRNGAGTVVGTQDVVVPVSTELSCGNCHGKQSGGNAFAGILHAHDGINGTTLYADAMAGHPHACAECHADNAVGSAGQPGIESLSVAMHKRHDGKVSNTTDGCYNCHPGPQTECLRGIMSRAGKGCVDCHGTMTNVWQTANNGRQPWLNEPSCSTCHGAKHAENAGTLYRNSVLRNTYSDMNGRIYCEACHNSTHAEYVSKNASDAVVPQSVQGNSYWIYNCAVCHRGGEENITFKGQVMHK